MNVPEQQPVNLWLDPGIFAVSGGGDSVALLRLAPRPLVAQSLVVYFDHALRKASEQEAGFVEHLALESGARFTLVRRREAFSTKKSIQDPARRWRRSVLLRLCKQFGFRWIYTGHTLDDWYETVYQQILRGRGFQDTRGYDLCTEPWVRPLRYRSRTSLRNYLRELGQAWLEDESNQSPVYQRNALRLHQLPEMARRESIFRYLEERGRAAAGVHRLAGNWLDRETSGKPARVCALNVKALPPRLLPSVLAIWLARRGMSARRGQIEMSTRQNIKLAVKGGWLVRFDLQIWVLTRSDCELLRANRDPANSPDPVFRKLLLDKLAQVLNVDIERGYPPSGSFSGAGPHKAKKLFRFLGIPALLRPHLFWFHDTDADRIVMELGSCRAENPLYLLP